MLRTLILATTALASTAASAQPAANPFAQPSTLPYQAPDFAHIKDTDFDPAFAAGIAQEQAEIAKIAADPAAPSFENTIVALEKAGETLGRVRIVFGALTQANTNPTLQKVQAARAQWLSEGDDPLYGDPKLAARVKTLHDRAASLRLDPEQAALLDLHWQRFVRAGAALAPADRATLAQINQQLSSLGVTFRQKLLAATKAGMLVLDRPEQLAGLGEDGIATAALAAKERGLAGKYVLSLQNTTLQPALQSLTDRATRKALFDKSWTRAEQGDANDTRATILQIIQLRTKKANLLGYPTWADFTLTDNMAKTAKTARDFMAGLDVPTAAEQTREVAEIQKVIDNEKGGFQLQPWDWDHYAEKVRKAKYDLNEEDTKPYLEIGKVLQDGVFYAANQLYGLSFKERKDLPTYDPDMRVFEVFEENGTPLGLMYFDYWKRDNKAGGAWMSNFVKQSRLMGTKPVIYNVANFAKPAPGQPQLITFEDVRTMFHEFGHALHGLFGAQAYPSISGTAVARDFVEFPSQFNEHWALEPRVLARYAVHYKTGAPMPAELVAKIKKAEHFNSGSSFGELLAAAQLDMSWHSLKADAIPADVDAFEAKALGETGLDIAHVPPRYRTSYFNHIWGSGYSAGYYAYIWTDMVEENIYAWFEANGGMTRANGQRLRDLILSKGRTRDYSVMFREMTGHDPELAPFLKSRGLVPE
ncbi:M3 family metallopeptidase [Sphingomonas sp. BIUV-7]|uniref:M3 family metallopeptidase n=1 Tax=Sphingomonas natans TaxID=3063330 RepID=A0ABT8YE35_9SPHN|nr:M3 family metallopeptidase [Sphingomonas sp. BIUV-7]MDO6416617.1 M3 family metallopeptidase [Sphingomonas sp. BIUV-7]